MTTLTQLIEHYCPNGVEYVKLGDVATVKAGSSVSKQKIAESAGIYPVINSGREPLGFIAEFNSTDPIGITTRGAGVGFVSWTEGPHFKGNLNYNVKVNSHIVSDRFLFFTLKEHGESIRDLCSFAGIPALNLKSIKTLVFPLPAREVQDAIVERLDSFAALIESLDTEIALREERFEYFREQIFDEVLSDEQIPSKPLGELGVTYGGMTGKTKKDFGHGTGRYVPYTTVFSNREVHFDDLQAVDIKPGERQRAIEAGDVLFTGSSESLEEVGFTSVVTQEPTDPIYLNSFCFGFRFNAGVSMSPHFIKHLLMIHQMRKQVMKSANGVTRINISKKSLVKNVSLPLPSLEAQQDIADKLDTMQALIDNLKQERELRKAQFEYYREKLLTFNS